MDRRKLNNKISRDIQNALHRTFSYNAIRCFAYHAQLEDITYCMKHGMNHMNGGKEEDKWYALKDEYEKLEDTIYKEDKNLDSKMTAFKNRTNQAVIDNDLYMLDVLEIIPTLERYAIQSLLYPGY